MNRPLTIPLIGVAGTQFTDYTVKQNLMNSKIQAETLENIYEKFRPDGLFTFMDLTVEAEALGLEINFPDNDTPSVIEHSIKTHELFTKLKNNCKEFYGRMPIFIDVVKRLKEKVDTTIGAYVIGPFTLGGEMNGVNDFLLNTIIDPEFVEEIICFNTVIISKYANALFSAGADTVCVLEPTAMMLSSDMYETFSLKPFREIHKNVCYNPLILHICGDTTHLIKKMSESGASGLSLDSAVDFKSAIKKIPLNMNLIGNINPVEVFLNGDKKQVIKYTRNLLDEMKSHPNFILSSGCDLPITTPVENIETFMKASKKI